MAGDVEDGYSECCERRFGGQGGGLRIAGLRVGCLATGLQLQGCCQCLTLGCTGGGRLRQPNLKHVPSMPFRAPGCAAGYGSYSVVKPVSVERMQVQGSPPACSRPMPILGLPRGAQGRRGLRFGPAFNASDPHSPLTPICLDPSQPRQNGRIISNLGCTKCPADQPHSYPVSGPYDASKHT